MISKLIPGKLAGYVLKQNLILMGICLGVGTGIYLLSDLFDRLDDFIGAGLGIGTILRYFVVKLPLIISQILPAVFLVSLIVQMGVMARNREMLALRSGGLSLGWFVRFFVIYAIICSLGQLLFSQVIGVYGEQEAFRIWKEDVRKSQLDKRVLHNIWFKDGNFVVEAREVMPFGNRAKNVTVYEFGKNSRFINKVTTAKEAEVNQYGWQLENAIEKSPDRFTSSVQPFITLPIKINLSVFKAVDPGADPAQLPLWQLSKMINQLEDSGSNVDRLLTSWHSKWSYAFSLVTMALVSLALITWSENIYVNIGLGLALTFAYYVFFMLGVSAGQKGVLPPMLAAWLGNIVIGTFASIRIIWVLVPETFFGFLKK